MRGGMRVRNPPPGFAGSAVVLVRAVRPMRRPPAFAVAVLLVGAGSGVGAGVAQAQRPFDAYDPLYRTESARRPFLGAYAVGAEATLSAPAPLADSTTGVPAGTTRGPFGLALHGDLALGPTADVGVVVDVAAVSGGQAVRWSWVVGRYGWTVDAVDYALRLALDPDSDGRTGFPQADLALFVSSDLRPRVSTDVGVGVRRVRRGFQEIVPGPQATPPFNPATDYEVAYGRAIGWEGHAVVTYNGLLSPSGSRVFATVSAEYGTYDLVRMGTATAPSQRTDVRAGVVWMRLGGEWARPSARVVPFLAVPLVRWGPPGPSPARTALGLDVTLR